MPGIDDLLQALERYYGRRHHYSVEQIRTAWALIVSTKGAKETIHEHD
jgi:hypothetical protein